VGVIACSVNKLYDGWMDTRRSGVGVNAEDLAAGQVTGQYTAADMPGDNARRCSGRPDWLQPPVDCIYWRPTARYQQQNWQVNSRSFGSVNSSVSHATLGLYCFLESGVSIPPNVKYEVGPSFPPVPLYSPFFSFFLPTILSYPLW